MVEKGVLGKTAQDSRYDFNDVYNFEEAFDLFGVRKIKSESGLELKRPQKNLKKSKSL